MASALRQKPYIYLYICTRAPDPADGRSSHIILTEIAEARLPDAVAALLRGNREASWTRRPDCLLPCSRAWSQTSIGSRASKRRPARQFLRRGT